MNINMKMLPYYINDDYAAPVLLISNGILFPVLIVTGHPLAGCVVGLALAILSLLCMVKN